MTEVSFGEHQSTFATLHPGEGNRLKLGLHALGPRV